MKDVMAMFVCSLCLLGCAGAFSPVQQVTTYLPARDAEQRLEQAFTSLGLPVIERARDGRVRTGRFDPETVWGGRTSDYLVCGRGGDDDPGAHDIRLEVIGLVRESASRPVRVEIESYGTGRNEKSQEIPCRLDDSAVDTLLSSIPHQDSRVGERQPRG